MLYYKYQKTHIESRNGIEVIHTMKLLKAIDIQSENKEEILPGFSGDFPYIASRAELDRYITLGAPWHWHRTIELFYVESGSLEYTTPHGKWIFPAGSGGMVNANVLHTSCVKPSDIPNVQLLHQIDPVFLAGSHGSRMEAKYILPTTSAPALEMIALYPGNPAHDAILKDIRQAFEISDQEWGYEFKLRETLTYIWLKLFELARPVMDVKQGAGKTDELMKALMVYVHENYPQTISVDQLADSVNISKRVCFRIFQDNLHMTPVEYIREYRLQKACQMLAEGNTPITQIAYCCGLGSSSYFGKTFRERFGCTPAQYRKIWHDSDKNQHK